MNKYKYEVREVDAWNSEEGWTWNTSYNVGTFATKGNEKKAFLNFLHKHGIVCKRGCCYVNYDGDIYELRNRKTQEPLYAAIPMF